MWLKTPTSRLENLPLRDACGLALEVSGFLPSLEGYKVFKKIKSYRSSHLISSLLISSHLSSSHLSSSHLISSHLTSSLLIPSHLISSHLSSSHPISSYLISPHLTSGPISIQVKSITFNWFTVEVKNRMKKIGIMSVTGITGSSIFTESIFPIRSLNITITLHINVFSCEKTVIGIIDC